MKGNLKKLNHILSGAQKRTVVGLGILILISGILETVGITAILPLVQAVVDKEGMLSNEWVRKICGFLGFILTEENFNRFIIVLLAAFVLIIVVKNLVLLLSAYLQARFINTNQFNIFTFKYTF